MASYSVMQSPPGPETVIDGIRYLYFGGTSYLGLAGHPEVIEAGCAAFRQFGVHAATSRTRFGASPPVLEVERRAATFFGTEDAFYFGGGYHSSHILVEAVAADVDAVLLDDASHYSVAQAALISAKPIVRYRHGDLADLARLAASHARVLVMADGVSPATGEPAPVREMIEVLGNRAGATLVLDDAHGFGVLGGDGRGVLDAAQLWPHANGGPAASGVILCVGGTLSKALGGHGGIIPGTRAFVARLSSRSSYLAGASAPAAAVAAASARALQLVVETPSLREGLKANVRFVRDGLRQMGLAVPDGESAHIGVSIGDADRMERIHIALKAQGVLVPYVTGYRGVAAEGLLRVAVFATHQRHQLERFLATLRTMI